MPQSVDESMVADLKAISRVYHLLSRLLISEVDVENLKLCQSPLRESFIEIGGWLPSSLDSRTVEELSHDFCQLFIGPSGHFPPYQSVWQYGQFQSQTIVSMEKYCNIARFTPSASHLMLDHLGVQMEWMGHVLAQVSSRSPTDRETIVEFANAFSNDHLQWPESMLCAAEETALTTFYRSNLKLIRQFLTSELEFWSSYTTSVRKCRFSLA